MKTVDIKKQYREIRVDRVIVNPMQPRKHFDQAELQELADSIREHGVIEPIVVEKCDDGIFMLHDGERRLRSARMAGLKKVPAIISPPLNGTGPRERLERGLVANIQRTEMHPIEEGLAYRRLMKDFKYEVKDVARRTGKHSTRIYDCLKLLKLEKQIQRFMLARKMTSERRVVEALFSVPKGKERIQLTTELVKRHATANTIILACRNYTQATVALKSRKAKGSMAIKLIKDGPPPEWDALYQLNKVPKWP